MVGLLDIAPLARQIPVNGTDLEVKGISAEGIAVLLNEFPELKSIIAGRDVDLSPDTLVQLVPNAIAAIIAAGCGYPGNPTAVATAAGFGLEAQLDVLAAIVELTMPKGVGPFLEKLQKAMGAFGSADLAKIQAIGLPSQSKS